ncbi:MAG TPA: PPC domain-containing protein [Pirellulales bacterium]
MIRIGAAALVLAIFSTLTAGGRAAPKKGGPRASEPKVTYLLPAAAASGETIDLAFHGTHVADATGVWTNLPGAEAKPVPPDKKDKADAVSRWRLTIPRGTPLGYYGIRLATTGGISNLRLLMIDDLPTLAEQGGNKTRETAQPLSLPVALEGATEPESYDYFRFRAERGQRLAVEVVARRLGSPLDPVIRLLRTSGSLEAELAYSDDDEALGADGRFVHTFADAGDYLLELRDIRYQGGADYRYRLRLGDFPLATATFPLGVQSGATAKLSVVGSTLDALPPLSVAVPVKAPLPFVRLAAQYAGGAGSTPLVVSAGDQPEQIEFEPNNSLETASPIDLVGAVNGRFEVPHDRDYFRFQAKKGEHWLLVGRTRTLGVPTDLFLRLYDAAGKQLAEVEDTAGEEGTIDYTVPADGTYRLMVEDLLNRGGPEQVYRVEFSRYEPGFSLSIDDEKISVPYKGVLALKVAAVRRGYNGAIELKLTGKDLPFAPQTTTIAAGKKDAVFIVPLPPGVEPGRHGLCQIVGQAKIDGKDFSTVARNTAALHAALSALATLPPDLDGWLAYGVGQVLPDFFKLKPDATTINYPQLVGTASLKIKATRVGKFADAITLTVEGLPLGISLKPVSIAKGKTEATLEFTGPAALAEASYALRLVGKATFENQPGEVVIDKLELRVTRPVAKHQ